MSWYEWCGGDGSVKILDDDATPTVTLEVDDDTVTEDDTFTVKVKLSDASANTTSTRIRTASASDDTATEGADYEALQQRVVFAPGETEKTFSIATRDDNVAEPTQSLSVELHGLSGLAAGETVTKKLFIEEEAADLAITYEVVEQTIRIGEDAGLVRVRTRLSRAVEGMEYTLQYWIASGTATSPGDYDAPTTLVPVPIGEGVTQVNEIIISEIVNDDVPEEDETFTITARASVDADLPITVTPLAGKGATTVTIVDDDMIAEIADARATEGNDIEFAVTADAPGFIYPIEAVYEVRRVAGDTIETRDVRTGSFTSQWTGAERLVRTIVVPTTEDTDEDNEQFTVRLIRIGTATLRRAEAKGTIIDRANSAYPVLTLTPNAIAENAGTTTVTATLSEAVAEAITVTIGASPEDALRLSGTGTIAFAANSTTSTDSVVLTAVDNTIFEGNVTVRVRGTISGSSEVRDAEPAELIIQEDEEAPVVSIRSDRVNIDEGESTTVRIGLNPASSDTITVNHRGSGLLEHAEEGKDFAPITGQVIFPPGETEKTLTLTAIDDDHWDPGESAVIEITLPGDQRALTTGERLTPPEPTRKSIKINDDDTTTYGFEGPFEITVNEDGGEAVLYVVFEERAQWHAALRQFLLSREDGTATSEDYDAQSKTITWGPDEKRVEVRIAITDDGIVEGPETFTAKMIRVSNDNPGSSISHSSVEITIVDDDRRELRLDTRSLAGEEGTELSYTVRLGSQPTADVTVTPTLTGSSTLEIHSSSQTLTFTPTDWNIPQTVRVLNPHDADEDDERATIVNAIAGGDYESESVTELRVEVSVRDDEGSGLRLNDPNRNATGSGVIVNEGESRRIAVRTDRVSDGTDVVELVNTGTASSADYVIEFEGRTVPSPHRIRGGEAALGRGRRLGVVAVDAVPSRRSESEPWTSGRWGVPIAR